MGLVQLLTAVESRTDALRIAHEAVDARVAACVQVLGPITSVYRWQREVEETTEFLCVFKVPGEGLDRLRRFVLDRHSYDTPELQVVESLFTDPRYLEWAVEQVG